MIRAEYFVEQAMQHGFGLYTGVPCSYLTPFINCVIDSKRLRYIGAANEGDAVAIAAGGALAGKRAVVMLQNSGLGNAVNPLTSLSLPFKIPMLLIITLRGDPSGPPDEPQHHVMGSITMSLLETMGIPWEYFPSDEGAVPLALSRALTAMDTLGLPYAFIMRKNTVAPHGLASAPLPRPLEPTAIEGAPASESTTIAVRSHMLEALRKHIDKRTLLIATTGHTGRELYGLGDHPQQFYMVGSMGCASSLGLGLAVARPENRVVVLDGDGAALMRLGALATLGYERPRNLLHVLFDNESHESTGGQATVSHSMDFAHVALACGYPRVVRCSTTKQLESLLLSAGWETTFVHCKVQKVNEASLPRPTVTPVDVHKRFYEYIQNIS